MYRSEVEEWLYAIGMPELSEYFLEDGFTSLDQVRRMRQGDIDSIIDRNGYMLVLNDEIDRLNYGGAEGGALTSLPPPAPHHGHGQDGFGYADESRRAYGGGYGDENNNGASSRQRRAMSYVEPGYENRETVMQRYQAGVPAVGFASRQLARRAKSKVHTNRAASLAANCGANRGQSIERYVPNSASTAYENLFAAKRAASVCALNQRELVHEAAAEALERRQQKREQDRSSRARSEMAFLGSSSDIAPSDNLDRGKFRDHYTNEYVFVEKNHITDVGCKYDGLSRKVDHKPSHWRCEDEIERGKEYKRMNDECADKIADNRNSIDNSRDWLTNDGGVIDRVHRMSAQTAKTRYDLDSIKRNMENIRAMRKRLLV